MRAVVLKMVSGGATVTAHTTSCFTSLHPTQPPAPTRSTTCPTTF